MQGTHIGSYIIEEKIGEGGMGVVYRARHTRMNRSVVIKMLHPKYAADPVIAKRFKNEANAAASIGHPGIVQVFDIDSHDGALYIVMELLAGESLQQRIIRVGQMPVSQAVTLVRLAASALAAAHAEGIIHRDLKPDNIFLVPDPEVVGGERVKLLDFGVAKLMGDAGASIMTQSGAMMGTPLYMSPEQCRGAGGVDHRTDLYALGVMMYQMLTGRPPFMGAGVGDLIIGHMTLTPQPVRELRPDVPPDVEQIVDVLLAKAANDRFATATALAQALTNCSSDTVPDAGARLVPVPVAAGKNKRAISYDSTVAESDAVAGANEGRVAAHGGPTTLSAAASAQGMSSEQAGRNRSAYVLVAVAVLVFGAGGVYLGTRGGNSENQAGSTTTSPADAAVARPDARPRVASVSVDAGVTGADGPASKTTTVATKKVPVPTRRHKPKVKPRPKRTRPKKRPKRKPKKKESDLENFERAKVFYTKGSQATRRGDHAEAVRYHLQAWRIRKDALFLFNVAQAFKRMGQNEQAISYYERFLRLRPGSKIAPQVRRTLKQLRSPGQ